MILKGSEEANALKKEHIKQGLINQKNGLSHDTPGTLGISGL